MRSDFHNAKILSSVLKELLGVEPRALISEPSKIYEIGILSEVSASKIGTTSPVVVISKRSLKHIIDQRQSADIILEMSDVISDPTKIVDNFRKRPNSYLLIKVITKPIGVVIEITKKPGLLNQVISAFFIDPKTYRKMKDISGGTAP